MRRLALLVAGLIVVATVTPTLAAAPRLQRELIVFSYDGTGPALLSVEGSVEAKGRPGYFAIVTANDATGHGPLLPFFPDLIELGEGAAPPHVYGAAGSHDVCASPVVTCTTTPGSGRLRFSLSYSVGRSERPTHVRLYLAMEGTALHADPVSIGWKWHTRTTGVRRALDGGTGARDFGTSVEALPAATLPGGRGGSIAIAIPPCDQLGAGTVTLSGGAQPDEQLCPDYAFADAANQATTWSLTGTSIGMSEYRTRLLVIDL